MFESSVLIVAHPDDEVLWFSSILRRVGKVIVAFRDFAAVPGLGDRRAAAMAELPYENLVCLGIDEAGSFKRANWADPVPTEFGLALDGDLRRSEPRKRYERNFATLRAALSAELSPGMNVFTHNPWGEYGHEDHVQVYRALDGLRNEIGFTLWMSGYCSNRSAALAARYSGADRPASEWLRIDRAYAGAIAEIYRRHGCWTWAENWIWAEEERFLRGPLRYAPADQGDPRLPLSFVAFDL